MTTKYFRSHQQGNQYEDLQKGAEIIYNITRPQEATDKGTDITLYEYALHEHPTNSGDWIAIIRDTEIPINPLVKTQSQGGGHITGWQSFFGGSESTTKKAIISGNTSGKLNAQDFVRSQWTEHTYAQLDTDGWFS